MNQHHGDYAESANDGLRRHKGLPEPTEAQRHAMAQFALIMQAPEFQATMETMANGVKATASRIYESVAPILESTRRLAARLAPIFAAVAENLGPFLERSLLPNWRLVDLPDPELIKRILEDEGIALAWVPAPAVLKRLIGAPDKQARRRVIGSSWKGIVNSCLTELEEIDDKELYAYRNFARESARALLGGLSGSSQALSANLLDTMIRRYVESTFRRDITGYRKIPLDMDMYSFREYFVWAGISGAHAVYHGQLGDQVPRGFTRHATAHGVSRVQYNRINAVIALMHVVALLRLLNSQPGLAFGANSNRTNHPMTRDHTPRAKPTFRSGTRNRG